MTVENDDPKQEVLVSQMTRWPSRIKCTAVLCQPDPREKYTARGL